MNLIDISKEVAESLFPDESWTEIYKNVFDKEFLMAKIASDNNHIVYLLPEISKSKNADAIMDGITTEFKNVTGGENAISHRFRDALHQGNNVYLKIDSEIKEKRVKQIIRGVLLEKENEGVIYCYLTKLSKMITWNMSDLKK